MDDKIYLPGSALWREQQAERARIESEVWNAWDAAHTEHVVRRERARLAKAAATAPENHFTVLAWPTSDAEVKELVVGARCPVCRRSWPMARDFTVCHFETTVTAGQAVTGVVEVFCQACGHSSDVTLSAL